MCQCSVTFCEKIQIFGTVINCSFHFLIHGLFVPHFCKMFTFHPQPIYFIRKTFKYGPADFFYVQEIHQSSANDFLCLIWIFWVCYSFETALLANKHILKVLNGIAIWRIYRQSKNVMTWNYTFGMIFKISIIMIVSKWDKIVLKLQCNNEQYACLPFSHIQLYLWLKKFSNKYNVFSHTQLDFLIFFHCSLIGHTFPCRL